MRLYIKWLQYRNYWIILDIHCNVLEKVFTLDLYKIFNMFVNSHSTHVMTICTRFDICSSGKVKSGEGYLNRVASFEQNRAYMKIRATNSPCTDNTLFRGHFHGFLRFVVWPNSGHFWGVYQSHYCASECTFLFSLLMKYASKYCFLFLWNANKVGATLPAWCHTPVKEEEESQSWGISCIYECFSFVYTWISLVCLRVLPWPLRFIYYSWHDPSDIILHQSTDCSLLVT